MAETRSYVEQFKPLCGESYYENIWKSDDNGIARQKDIIILVDGVLKEDTQEDNEAVANSAGEGEVATTGGLTELEPSPCWNSSSVYRSTIINSN